MNGSGFLLRLYTARGISVTQVRLFGGRCTCCGERVTAKAPAGLEPGSPFGLSIAAMVVYLHYAHAIGMERLALLHGQKLLDAVTGKSILRAGFPCFLPALN